MSDNGSSVPVALASPPRARPSEPLAICCTRAYTPRTNGKAERFIQTLLREWAYAVAYVVLGRTAPRPSDRWLHYYNWHRAP